MLYHINMDISGPCFVVIKNGMPFNKYEVAVRTKTPKGVQTTYYWFKRLQDAELYRLYLIQVEGLKDLDSTISSNRTYHWERKELETFRDSLDLETLPRKVQNIVFTTETVFVETRYANK